MLYLALLVLVASQAEDPVAHWKFDGDIMDSGKKALPTKAIGRLEYIDSPVGPSGRLAVFNGVDSYVRVDPPTTLGAGENDFILSAWILILDRRPATLFARKGWSVDWTDSGQIHFKSDFGTIAVPAGSCPLGQWAHLFILVSRVERGGKSHVFVNGRSVGVGDIREGDLDPPQTPLLIGKSLDKEVFFGGLIDDVRLYSHPRDWRAIQTATSDGMPWLRFKAFETKKPFPGKFELLEDDVVSFVGGEDVRVGQELGYLETLLTLHVAGKHVHFRNMAWEGDTVYEQLRPLNFGSWSDQFRRNGTSVVVAQFGQIEALQGKGDLQRFEAAYEGLLEQFEKTTKRIVLVSPAPFGKAGPRVPDLTARNDDLKLYVDAIRKLADRHGYLFVDLSTPAMAAAGLSRDGLHLSDAGQWTAARETARQLEISGVSDLDAPDAKGAFRRESLEKLRGAIRYKNVLWTGSWRPMNWAFLNGDRMEQPSSRDHVDRRVRWFPVEVQQNAAMLRREEEKIGAQVEKK